MGILGLVKFLEVFILFKGRKIYFLKVPKLWSRGGG